MRGPLSWNRYAMNLSCCYQYLAMTFAPLTYREPAGHRDLPRRGR
jgi:hypothetical protein